MVGWRFPEMQERLLRDIEPEQVAYEKSLDDPHMVKKEIEYRLEDILEGIGQEQRELLYGEARRFNTLHHLVFFAYERILSQFLHSEAKNRYQAAMSEVREPLNELAQILFTLQDPPTEGMIKILFIFYLQNEFETESSQDIDAHLQELLKSADRAFNAIRTFNQKVPLLQLLRLSKRNLEYVPTEIGGGEDWYVLFKQFWYRRFEHKIKLYTQEQKRRKLLEDAENFLKLGEFPRVRYYDGKPWEGAGSPRYAQSLGFVRGFVENYFFGDLHGPLKLILIDGEFYKDQNRDEYNDAYNGMLKIQDEIKGLEYDLSPDGEVGKRLEQAKSETGPRAQAAPRITKALRETDKRAEQLIGRTIDSLSLMTHIIEGILYGDVGGRYDTLSNLGYIGRGENKNLSQKLSGIKNKISSFLEILTDLFDTEKQL
jgi:hypothetical protein